MAHQGLKTRCLDLDACYPSDLLPPSSPSASHRCLLQVSVSLVSGWRNILRSPENILKCNEMLMLGATTLLMLGAATVSLPQV